ncbi:non-ribosomal peptide synthetase [Pyxidicoccus trucidator]|uniref:non-ribosomal peptide synthetase n=1 Tax=Pyxidicoccus trucidator TaxID=2709662 RepID=UPI001F07F026|nr:non-ribosomal peptide synthetase [Pyxidicoccus trucidator]
MEAMSDGNDPARASATLVDLLRERARLEPDFTLYTFLVDGEEQEERLTCAELDRRARMIAAGLSQLAPGERVLLLYPPGLDYIAAFFGCLYAGVVAVPVYPPRHDRSLARLQAITLDAQATAGLIRTEHLELLRQFFPLAPELERLAWIATDTLDDRAAETWAPPALTGAARAFFQYTSGSTSLPKGVMLTHRNLLRNLEAIRIRFQQTRDSRVVTWLPPYHDMGLIGGLLQPLYTGYPAVLMSPADFLQQPLRWLRAISRYRATTSGGPDFAYALCVRKVSPEQCAELDLRSWRVAFNGAEPIRQETLENFARTFGPSGFRRETFLPCYGLAEATLLVAGGEVGRPPRVELFEGASLQRGQAVPAAPGLADAQALVSSGRNALDGQLLIVEPELRAPVPDGTVGEVWVSGSSVAEGYWSQPEASARTFHATLRGSGGGPFLRTGDLGFVRDGELFVTGRAKDLLIIRGLNHYPQDIERTVERSHPALRPGSGAAFSVEAGGEERLVIVYEVSAKLAGNGLDEVLEAIRRAVSLQHELAVHAVELLEPGTVPKTSSGKIQRHACRAGFVAGELQPLARFTQSGAAGNGSAAPGLEAARAPLSPLGQAVAEEVSRVLGHPAPEASEPLLLDSLSSVELQHRLQARLKATVPLTRLLRGASLEELVTEVETALAASGDLETTPGAAAPATGDFPLSHGQRALWFLQQLAPDSAAYHIAAALRVLEPLDPDAFRRAVLQLIERHPALRTTFHAAGGEPFQRLHASGALDLEPRAAPPGGDEALRQALREEASRPFDLERGPLLRVRLYPREGGEHALLVVVHHLVADLWSLGQLAGELSVAYPAALRGARGELAEAGASYVDFVHRQRGELEGERGARLWDYWRKRLTGPAPVLEHLADHRRPPVQTYRGGRRERLLAPELTARLKRLAGDEGTTVFAALLAGYASLLHRHNGQRELWVGTPTAGRDRVEQAQTVGYFVNPVVLRVELSPDLPFRALVAEVGRTVREALEHAALPLSVLVERLAPARDASRSPLFQTMFALQQLPLRSQEGLAPLALGVGGARLALGGLAMESIELDAGTAQFDLSLAVAEVEGRLHVTLEYNADLFEPGTAERLLQRYERLLAGAVIRPEAMLAALPIDSAADRARLLEWGRPAEAPAPACVQAWIETQAQRAPGAFAVLSDAGALTYAELDARANALAWRLRALGVGPEVPVAIYLERSLEQIIAVLGVLKAGGAYVPLDPEFSAARLGDVLTDAGIRTAIIGASHAPLFSGHDVAVVNVGGAEEVRREPPPSTLTPENLAYVIYTSGSTGRPKGVMISHRALASLVHAERALFEISAADRILQFNSLSFDSSVEEIFLALATGATLVLRDAAMLATAEAFLEGCRRWDATVLDLPTAFWHTLTAALEEQGLALPPSLRLLIVAGERVHAERVSQWHRRAPASIRLIDVYGPTEGTVSATSFDLPAELAEDLEEVPIGRPLRTMGAYVLDGRLEPVPTGGVGELWLAGEGLARGYFGDPALTAERFVPDPHATTPGARLYRTGDLARVRADGVLEFLGRADAQVKVRGFRVELGELEAALRTCEGVRDALVLLRTEAPGRPGGLVAYAVAPPQLTPSGMRAHLAARLPPYMVPAHFVRLEAFPYNSSGKVDRRALPEPDAPDAGLAPRTAAEEVLAGIWADVLRLERVGVDQGFFELGGHSLLAMQVISRIRDAFGVELPVRALFEEGTVAALAARLEQARAGARPAVAPPLVPVPRDVPLPLSFAQQRLWLLARLEPDSAAYNEPGVLRLSGPLEPTALEGALAELLRRHELLRTRFVERDGEPLQLIEPAATVPLPLDDLRSLPPAAREARAEELTLAEVARPFALERAPLLRARLLRLADEEHRLVVVLHHIVCDAWSLGILFRDLAALYEARKDGRAASLPALGAQYADFAVWQRRWLQGAVLERQLTYWRRTLEGAPTELEFPLARGPRTAAPGPCGAVRRALPRPLISSLESLCRREGATPFMALLATFQALLHRYTGERDLVVGTPVAHRTHAALEPLVGFFVNTLVLRTRGAEGSSFRQWLASVREGALGAFSHQDLPFEKLVEALRLARASSRPPFLQFMFALQNAPEAHVALAGVHATLDEPLPAHAKFDVLLEVFQRGDAWIASWQFDTALLDDKAVGRMAEHFERLLAGALARPDAPLARLPLLTEAEQALISAANSTGQGVPRDASLSGAFEAQADRTPDATAVELEGQALTYRELDRRANQLARYLRGLEVGPGMPPVGLCLHRSFELIIGMLGILKAGGAYLPLEPSHPPERLARVLADAGARWVLTETSLLPALEGAEAGPLPLDTLGPSLAVRPGERFPSGVMAEDLAYVMYTSGSTGRPKGVCVPHRAVIRLVSRPNYLTLTADDAFLQLAPTAFDAATLEIWGPLLNGGRLVLFPEQGAAALEALGPVLARHRVTSLWLTAGLFHSVVERELEALGTVRQLLAGGDVLSPEHVRRVLERHPRLRLINGYGPTENTTFTCCHPMASPAEVEAPVPIGAPITGTQVYVLDAALEPVPVGVPGELYCAGDGLAHGYLGRPELTAERFLSDPFSREPGARMYRTGDRARWRADGRLDFLGRVDQQVKIRGFRVEPGEIETALLGHPAVRDASVVAVGDRADTRRLVAHVVLRDASAVTPEALRAFLSERLPGHLVPGAVALHAALPLTPNGKVDRRALAAEPLPAGTNDPAALAPRTRTEATLAAIWSELLGVARIGLHENFFALGGHSLMATRLLSRVREATGVELRLKTLFEAGSISALAERIDAARASVPAATRPLSPVPREGAMPLSFSQQRLWFIAQLDPHGAAYHVPGALRLTGELDVRVLEQCFNTLLERHEVLRTAFVSRDGTPAQRVEPRLTLRIPVEDLRALPPPARQPRARELERQEAEQPFALDAPPLLRVRLLQLDDREHLLLLTLHHIVSDGWSLGVLFREVTALYEAFSTGRESPLPPLPIQYADFAWWQREWLKGSMLESQLQYWRQHLAGAPPRLSLPFDFPPPELPSHHGKLVVGRIDEGRTAALEALGKRSGATLFMTALCAFYALLHRLTGAEDLVVGTPLANRTHPFTEDLVGFFVNTLALRCQVRGDMGFAQLLDQVRAITLAAQDHQDVPFDRVVNELGIERSLSHNPVFQVLFVLQNAPLPALRLKDLTLSEVEPNFDRVKFDLVVILQEHGGGLTVTWSYAAELFEEATVTRMHQQYEGLLGELVSGAASRVGPPVPAPQPQLQPQTERRTSDFERLRTIKPRPLNVPPKGEER